MHTEPLPELDALLAGGDASQALDFLARRFREERRYPLLFEARLMMARHDLGLPLVQTEGADQIPAEKRAAYEQRMIDAAREVGGLFLADGEIERAWPYFRAMGEPGPVVEAIDQLEPREGLDGVIGIAFQEGIHPRKGLELLLAQHGMCRAVTCFGMYAVSRDREECICVLARHLHSEIGQRMRYAIEQREGLAPPPGASLRELMEGRDWLFGEYDYYVDTSHLMSVLQYAPELTQPEALRLMGEICDYGRRLSSQFQQGAQPPFDQPFADYGWYVRALLGEQVDDAVAHFRAKAAAADPEDVGTLPAQVLLKLLLRLERYPEALDLSLQFLDGQAMPEFGCPSALQICHMAGDYSRLTELARERGDLLSYAAGRLEVRQRGV